MSFSRFAQFAFVAGFLLAGESAWAQAASKGAVANSAIETHLAAGFIGISSSSSQYDMAPGIDIRPVASWPGFQIGGEIDYQKMTYRGGSVKNVILSVGPTINFGPVLGDAGFISVALLIKSGTSDYVDPTALDPDGIGYCLFAGKRFPLSGSLSMRPSIGIQSAGTTGFIIRPLAISWFL